MGKMTSYTLLESVQVTSDNMRDRIEVPQKREKQKYQKNSPTFVNPKYKTDRSFHWGLYDINMDSNAQKYIIFLWFATEGVSEIHHLQ